VRLEAALAGHADAPPSIPRRLKRWSFLGMQRVAKPAFGYDRAEALRGVIAVAGGDDSAVGAYVLIAEPDLKALRALARFDARAPQRDAEVVDLKAA